jgi:hypothetical protein
MTTDRQHQTGHGRRSAQARETRVGPGRATAGFKPLCDRVFTSGGAFAHQHGWEITKTTTRSGFGARSYGDPRCAGAALDGQLDIPGYRPATAGNPPPTSPHRPTRAGIAPRSPRRNGRKAGSRMTTKRDSEMTGEEVRELAGLPRATTYDQAETGYRCTIDARERFEELSNRDLMVRAHATLKARGTYDPHKHGYADRYQPLTAAEHLEILAAGEMLARYYRHPALIDHAVKAGASWPEIAAATGSDEAKVRQGYREWADGQHRLYADYQGKFGLNDAEHAAAISRAAGPPVSEHDQDWAGRGFTRRGAGPAPEHRGGGHQAEAGS